MRYRRADVKGGTNFFTVNLTQRHPFHIDAFVVLPDHLSVIQFRTNPKK